MQLSSVEDKALLLLLNIPQLILLLFIAIITIPRVC